MNDRNWGLRPEEIDRIRTVLAAHPKVINAAIYGSRALGTHRPGSDIDLYLSPPYSSPFRREGSPGRVVAAFCDRAHRKRTRLYGEDARPSETPQARGLAAPQQEG